jgi:GTP 3',8-cyclase
MYDQFNRHINYLRISVTDRCNLRCSYCMPECGVDLMTHDEILSFEEIIDVVKAAVSEGITKIRLTGGEPLVRKGIINLVHKIASVDGIQDLAMTTNGILLNEMAKPLKEAGLQRVNISLDTLNAERFKDITRGGNIDQAISGIEAARKAGLNPVKINCVKFNDSDKNDIDELKKFCADNNLEIRFIRQMNLESGEFSKVEGGTGGNCPQCNRLRLTANGMVKPCLFDESEFSVRELGARKALILALNHKPLYGCQNKKNSFYNIGG